MFLAECSGAFLVSGSGNVQCTGVLTSIETASFSSGSSSSFLPPLSIADAATIASAIVLVWVAGWVIRLLKGAMGSR